MKKKILPEKCRKSPKIGYLTNEKQPQSIQKYNVNITIKKWGSEQT